MVAASPTDRLVARVTASAAIMLRAGLMTVGVGVSRSPHLPILPRRPGPAVGMPVEPFRKTNVPRTALNGLGLELSDHRKGIVQRNVRHDGGGELRPELAAL